MEARSPQKFAHVLIFRCGGCHEEITAVRKSEYMNREHIARLIFDLKCGACGWAGNLGGISAMGHAINFDRATHLEPQSNSPAT